MAKGRLRLTDLEEAFCMEYVKTYNAAEAYRSISKYRRNINSGSIKKRAWALLQDPLIQQRIAQLKKELSEIAMISRYKILKEYEGIAFASFASLQKNWLELKEFESLTPEQKAVISEIQVSTKREWDPVEEQYFDKPIVRIKLHDKLRALDSIAKMLGYDTPEQANLDKLLPAPPVINIYNGQAPPFASEEKLIDK